MEFLNASEDILKGPEDFLPWEVFGIYLPTAVNSSICFSRILLCNTGINQLWQG